MAIHLTLITYRLFTGNFFYRSRFIVKLNGSIYIAPSAQKLLLIPFFKPMFYQSSIQARTKNMNSEHEPRT